METVSLTLGEGVYTIPEVAEILNLSPRKVSYWVNVYLKDRLQKEQGFQYHTDIGRQSVVNFYSLIETYTFFRLKEGGVPKKRILTAHQVLAKRYKTVYPFAHASILRSGGRVLFTETSGIISADDTLQLHLEDVIKPFCERIQFAPNGLAEAYYPLGPKTKVVVSPQHQFGQPTVEGTNILASTIFELNQAGDSRKLIKGLYNLTDKQVDHAIQYFRRAA